ncbi:MAG TPA: hypothetical protein VG014_11870 [Acidimicrobiales bacterium]|nr:hypothetical protein [Acidimicrobiales bacterium]
MGVYATIPVISVGAATTPSPTISLDRSTGLLQGQIVNVTGSGFAPFTFGQITECSNAPGQPTIASSGVDLPVSCGSPNFSIPAQLTTNPFTSVSQNGVLTGSIVVETGVLGPPALGTDSAGNNAAVDAVKYSCPPTAAQTAAGVTCVIAFAGAPVPPSASGASPATFTSAPIAFGTPITTSPSLTASPSTGLAGNTVVTLTGSGFTPFSPGIVSECNLTPGEPTATYSDPPMPVGCTSPTQQPIFFPPTPVPSPTPSPVSVSYSDTFTTDSAGGLRTTFAIREGNIGGSVQSSPYPCPPTAAQQVVGGHCSLIVDDAAGESASQTIQITGPPPVATLSVVPATGLHGGDQVAVTGSGLAPQAAGAVVECNGTTGEPTIAVDGIPAPVGCSNPFASGALIGVSGTGTFSTTFTIGVGVLGPPVQGLDSAGGNAATDAANYPCPPTPAQVAAGATCFIGFGDLSGDSLSQPISIVPSPPPPPPVPVPASSPPIVRMASTPDGGGYWLAASDGGVFAYGDARFFGSAGGTPLQSPVVGMAATPDGGGYWLVASDGGMFAYGDAGFFGSSGAQRLNQPIVGMAPTPDGRGYWLVASDGGMFAYGDAGFFGSTGAMVLNRPIVGMAATPDGKGYWLVASDGGVFAFGDAAYFGSTGAMTLNKPIVGMAATPDGKGYWLVASDGGIFAYGDAGFFGSTGAMVLNKPIVGMAATPDGKGYWLAAADRGVFAYGDAGFFGSR